MLCRTGRSRKGGHKAGGAKEEEEPSSSISENTSGLPLVDQWLILHSQFRGHRFVVPVHGTRSRMPQLQSYYVQLKILHAVTKTQAQTNKIFKKGTVW